MQATSILSSGPSTRNGSRQPNLLSLGKVATLLGVHISTARRLVDNGELDAVVMRSGHRRVPYASVRAFLGEDEENNVDGEIAVYCRVSSNSQDCKSKTDGKSSLDRQMEAVLEHIQTVEGVGQDKVRKYVDVASSFGDRKSLNRLVDDIIDGRIKKLFVRFWDRLSRIPALTLLISHICERFGVEIVAIEEEEDKTAEQEFSQDILMFITVYSCRASARKSALVTTKTLSNGAIERAVFLREKGWTLQKITEQLAKEGFYCETAQGKKSPISWGKLKSLLDSNGTESVINAACGKSPIVKQTSTTFINEKIEKGNEEDKITVASVYPSYVKYCQKLDQRPEPRTMFGQSIKNILGPANYKTQKASVWVGWTLI